MNYLANYKRKEEWRLNISQYLWLSGTMVKDGSQWLCKGRFD